MNKFKLALLSILTIAATSAFATENYPDLSDPNDLSPTLIGGTVADPKDWPASPYIGVCSSTIIGPRALLTAAHCVSNGGTARWSIGTTRYTSTCRHHSEYRGNSTADHAICFTDTEITGIEYESIATPSEAECSVGKRYLWTGYGCQRWGGSLDGKFRTGLVATTKCPSGTNYDIVTRGSVALCSGDSGGGGYVILPSGLRKVVGVNSRSNTTDTSYVSAIFLDKFRSWIKAEADSRSTTVCGIHAGAQRCKGGGSNPDPDPDPAPDCKAEMDAVSETLSSHNSAVAGLKACLDR